MWHLKGTSIRSVANFCLCKHFEKKFERKDMIVPQDFQKEGLENRQPGIVKPRCQVEEKHATFDICHHMKKKKEVIIYLEMNDKCKNDHCPTSQKDRNNKSNH